MLGTPADQSGPATTPALNLENARIPASFRDPAGFLFPYNGRILRFIKQGGMADYEAFTESSAGRKLPSLSDRPLSAQSQPRERSRRG